MTVMPVMCLVMSFFLVCEGQPAGVVLLSRVALRPGTTLIILSMFLSITPALWYPYLLLPLWT